MIPQFIACRSSTAALNQFKGKLSYINKKSGPVDYCFIDDRYLVFFNWKCYSFINQNPWNRKHSLNTYILHKDVILIFQVQKRSKKKSKKFRYKPYYCCQFINNTSYAFEYSLSVMFNYQRKFVFISVCKYSSHPLSLAIFFLSQFIIFYLPCYNHTVDLGLLNVLSTLNYFRYLFTLFQSNVWQLCVFPFNRCCFCFIFTDKQYHNRVQTSSILVLNHKFKTRKGIFIHIYLYL